MTLNKFTLLIVFSGLAVPSLRADEMVRYHTDALRYELYSDTPSMTTQLMYFDNEDNTSDAGVVKSEATNDQTVVNKGRASLKMTFHMPAGPQFYSGWFFLRSEGTVDISDKAKVAFNLRTSPGVDPHWVQVGIRSTNVPAGSNHAKIYLSELGIQKIPSDKFMHIEVPTSMLQDREPDLDLTRVKEVFIVGIVGPDKPLSGQSLWIDGLTWQWGFTRVAGGLKATLSSGVLFDTAQWNLRPDALRILDAVAKEMEGYRDHRTHFDGGTDIRGGDEYNMDLSRKRARSVADYLTRKAGLDPHKVIVTGFGKTNPVAPNDTPENMQRNRRVEIFIEDGTKPATEDQTIKPGG